MGEIFKDKRSTLFLDDVYLEYAAGVREGLTNEMKVNAFPSPATNLLKFEFDTQESHKLNCFIYSIDGQLIQSFTPSSNNHDLDVSTWKQGKYIIQVLKEGSTVSSTKFTVVH